MLFHYLALAERTDHARDPWVIAIYSGSPDETEKWAKVIKFANIKPE